MTNTEAFKKFNSCVSDEEDGAGYLWDFIKSGGGEVIRKALKQADLVEEMAEQLGITMQAFIEIEKSIFNPNWYTGGYNKASEYRIIWLRKGKEANKLAIQKYNEIGE